LNLGRRFYRDRLGNLFRLLYGNWENFGGQNEPRLNNWLFLWFFWGFFVKLEICSSSRVLKHFL
jgi:hypothetical protein